MDQLKECFGSTLAAWPVAVEGGVVGQSFGKLDDFEINTPILAPGGLGGWAQSPKRGLHKIWLQSAFLKQRFGRSS